MVSGDVGLCYCTLASAHLMCVGRTSSVARGHPCDRGIPRRLACCMGLSLLTRLISPPRPLTPLNSPSRPCTPHAKLHHHATQNNTTQHPCQPPIQPSSPPRLSISTRQTYPGRGSLMILAFRTSQKGSVRTHLKTKGILGIRWRQQTKSDMLPKVILESATWNLGGGNRSQFEVSDQITIELIRVNLNFNLTFHLTFDLNSIFNPCVYLHPHVLSFRVSPFPFLSVIVDTGCTHSDMSRLGDLNVHGDLEPDGGV